MDKDIISCKRYIIFIFKSFIIPDVKYAYGPITVRNRIPARRLKQPADRIIFISDNELIAFLEFEQIDCTLEYRL